MTGTIFIILLTCFSSMSALIVEAIKTVAKKIKGKKMTNATSVIIALIVSFVCGSLGTWLYFILGNLLIGSVDIICIFLEGFAVCLVSQVGYDKVHEIVKMFV